jgi:phage tail sheath protein FI
VTFRNRLNVANSYGAVYVPWLLASDPSNPSAPPTPVPPSGHIAGLYGRIDGARGVWKAPAGVEAALFNVSGLTAELSDVDHGVLNPLGVDVIRRFPAAGVVAFGARTITSDPAWRYVPVRRTAIMLRVSIYAGIQWAVFEPNDETLWSQLRLAVTSFMTSLFRQGAFAGETAREAFFVKCDGDTTTPDDIARGVVNVQVGFAPLAPAEFVVVTISQLAGQAAG